MSTHSIKEKTMSGLSITYIESISAFFLTVPIDEGDVHGQLTIRINDPGDYELYAWETKHTMDPVQKLLTDLLDAGVEFERLSDLPGSHPSGVDHD
jgi:hypothetical protein